MYWFYNDELWFKIEKVKIPKIASNYLKLVCIIGKDKTDIKKFNSFWSIMSKI